MHCPQYESVPCNVLSHSGGPFALLAVALCGGSMAAEEQPANPVQLVDSLHQAFGNHHAHAVHNRGVLLPNPATADKALMFSPGNVTPGIEPADPMIAARSASYAISFGERQ